MSGEHEQTIKLRVIKGKPEPKVIPHSGNEIKHENCLVIDTFPKSSDPSVVLAKVYHYAKNDQEGGFPWNISEVTRNGIRFPEALTLANGYALERDVPVILVNQDGFSSESDKLQSDTVILNTKNAQFD